MNRWTHFVIALRNSCGSYGREGTRSYGLPDVKKSSCTSSPTELSSLLDWCFNGQQSLPRRKDKSSVSPWQCQQGSLAKFKDTATVSECIGIPSPALQQIEGTRRTFLLPFRYGSKKKNHYRVAFSPVL